MSQVNTIEIEIDVETAHEEMNAAAVYVAEAVMRGLDTTKLVETFRIARERYLDALGCEE